MTDKFPFERRVFLKSLAVGTATGGALFQADNIDADDSPATVPFSNSSSESDDLAFPQGAASGDPSPDGFLLWTRAPSVDNGKIDFQVSDTVTFDRIIRHGTVTTWRRLR